MSLQDIKEKALELSELRETKAKLNDSLKDTNEKIANLEGKVISTMMDDEGITDVTVDDVRIKRGVIFRGSVTSHTDKDAFKYLFDTNNEGALKQHVIVDLAQYPNITKDLAAMGVEYNIQYSIHHMTLSSLIKELVMDGKLSTADFEKYSIYAQPQIKVEIKE